jgi:hypothetical protein
MDGSYIRQNRDTMPVFNRIITKAKQVNPRNIRLNLILIFYLF